MGGRYRPERRRHERKERPRAACEPTRPLLPTCYGASLRWSPLHESSQKRERPKGCYLESLQRLLPSRANEVKSQAAEEPATETLPDPRELPARIDTSLPPGPLSACGSCMRGGATGLKSVGMPSLPCFPWVTSLPETETGGAPPRFRRGRFAGALLSGPCWVQARYRF